MNKKPLWTYPYKILKGKNPPERFADKSFLSLSFKPIRKWLNVSVIPNCPFNKMRVALYRAIGFDIGKNVFIGMRCYLDDMCYDQMKIGDNVTISYGVYFACHGKNQPHLPITVDDGAYIGMCARVISKNVDEGGSYWQKRYCRELHPC